MKSFIALVTVALPLSAQAPAKQAAPPAAPKQSAVPASYKKEIPARLAAKAKITEAAAAAAALARIPGGTIEGVELEEEGGAFIYSYDVKVAGKKGIEEVHVDAMTGKVLKTEHEDPSSGKKEAADDKKPAKKTPAPPGKP